MTSATTKLNRFDHYIGGRYLSSQTGEVFVTINSANAHEWGSFVLGVKADVDRAVEWAHSAQKCIDNAVTDTARPRDVFLSAGNSG